MNGFKQWKLKKKQLKEDLKDSEKKKGGASGVLVGPNKGRVIRRTDTFS